MGLDAEGHPLCEWKLSPRPLGTPLGLPWGIWAAGESGWFPQPWPSNCSLGRGSLRLCRAPSCPVLEHKL